MQVKFINKPIIEPVDDECWRLMTDFYVEVDGLPYTVETGFVTDGASIPRFLWRLCGHPMSTKRLPAAVFHDWLYDHPLTFTRADADAIYRDGLIALGFSRFKANLEYYALRLFGGSHYNKENT